MPHVKYPDLFGSADTASARGQAWYLGYVSFDLLLITLAALLGGLSSVGSTSWRQGCAILAALAVGSAAIVRGANRLQRPNRQWFDGRAVAESVKTATWQYMMRVHPFDNEATADREFISELRDIMKARQDLRLEVDSRAQQGQITDYMRRTRALPFADRKIVYLKDRAIEQVRWYADRSDFHRRRAKVWFLVGLCAELIALAVAIARAVTPAIINLIGLFSALAAGATAFAQLHSHDELARSYGLAAQELGLIESLIQSCTDEASFAELMKSSEGAISREHTMWVAKRG